MRVAFELTGKTAILMHQDDVEQADTLEVWRKSPENKNVSRAGDDRSPAWTWQTYLYNDEKNVVIPSQNLMVCLRQAGARKIMKRQTTFKEITQSGLVIEQEFLDLYAGVNGKSRQIAWSEIARIKELEFAKQAQAVRDMGFRLYVKRARVGQAKHIRVRARFDDWTVKGVIEVVATKEITFDVLKELFELAGKVGLLDWRPGCKTPGPFGMFDSHLKRLD